MLVSLRRAFHDPKHPAFYWVDAAVWVLIVFSILLFAQELLWGRAEGSLLDTIDQLVLWLFVLEITLRIGTYHPPALDFYQLDSVGRLRAQLVGRLRFALQPLNLIDIATVLALAPALRGLRALRLLRLVRTGSLFRYTFPLQGVLRAFRDNALLFGAAFSGLSIATIVGGLSLFLIERGPVNPNLNTISDGLWWALVTLTTVGFGDISPQTWQGRVVGSVLMVVGMFTLALFAGIIGNTLLRVVLSVREEQFRMSGYLNHIIICGYDPGAAMLLEVLVEEVDPDAQPIVLFANGERPTSLDPRLIWVSGDPTKESELAKVRMTHAGKVIVVGPRDTSPQQADARTILTLFTIRRVLAREGVKRERPLYIIAEVLDAENVAHAVTAGADEVIESTRIGFALMTHALVHPGTANTLAKVVSVDGPSVLVGTPFPTGEHEVLPYASLVQQLKVQQDLLVIGLRVDEDDVLNPPADHPIPRGSQLLYLGRSGRHCG